MAGLAGITAALSVQNDVEACKQFCTRVLGSGSVTSWGPLEQRAILEKLPLLMQRLYVWLTLPSPGVEEALLRTFHPSSTLSTFLASLPAATFVFPLRLLPPRVIRAVMLASAAAQSSSSASATAGRGIPGRQMGPGLRGGQFAAGMIGMMGGGFGSSPAKMGNEGYGSEWYSLLGSNRLATSSSGNIEGVLLTASEYVLTCLVHYFVHQEPLPQASKGPAQGGHHGGSSSSSGFGGGGGGGGGFGEGLSSTFGGPDGRQPSKSQSATPGAVSTALERLLIAYLGAMLPHGEYQLTNRTQEQMAARFLSNMLQEFLIAPWPEEQRRQDSGSRGCAAAVPDVSSYSAPPHLMTVSSQVRARSSTLQAVRLVLVHLLSNPTLRRGCCEEARGVRRPSNGPESSVRLTREMALLGPSILLLLIDLLTAVCTEKQSGLELLSSLMRLWLTFLQPWNARRLGQWYGSCRSPEPILEPPLTGSGGAAAGAKAPAKTLDLALVGLGLEVPSGRGPGSPLVESPGPFVLGAAAPSKAPAAATLASSALSGLGTAVSGGSSASSAAAPPPKLLPGDGDAATWSGYVARFHGAYCLFEAFLTAPLHTELCLQLCKALAGASAKASSSAGGVGAAAASAAAAVVGSSSASSSSTAPAADAPVFPDSLRLGAGAGAVYTGATASSVTGLLRQKHVLAALRTLAQALLCLSDPKLLSILAKLPGETGGLQLPAMAPFVGHGASIGFAPSLALAVATTWAALLSASAASPEMKPIVVELSTLMQRIPDWVMPQKLPEVKDTAKHKPFAIEVLTAMAEQQMRRGQAHNQAPVRDEMSRLSVLGAFHHRAPAPAAAAATAVAPPKLQFATGVSALSEASFLGSEWERPVRGGEAEILLQLAYWLACLIDWVLNRQPNCVAYGQVPQTEWPRMLANWKFSFSSLAALLLAAFW